MRIVQPSLQPTAAPGTVSGAADDHDDSRRGPGGGLLGPWLCTVGGLAATRQLPEHPGLARATLVAPDGNEDSAAISRPGCGDPH
jgi:hypothetical protein